MPKLYINKYVSIFKLASFESFKLIKNQDLSKGELNEVIHLPGLQINACLMVVSKAVNGHFGFTVFTVVVTN